MIKAILREKLRDAAELVLRKPPSGAGTPPGRRLPLTLPIIVEEPKDHSFGDYATSFALQLAKFNGWEVQKAVSELLKHLDLDFAQISEKNGFLNFRLTADFLRSQVPEILKLGKKFGQSSAGKDSRALVEFISANPTGPLTLGNGRGGFYGDVLARVFASYGCKVEREYYINDRGNQIVSLGNSVLGKTKDYQGDYIEGLAERVKEKDPQKAGRKAAVILMEESIKKTIHRMGITFDQWYSEQGLYDDGTVAHIIGMLERAKLIYRKEGAVWFKTTPFGDDKDRVLITKKGEYTYFVSDIAYHYRKMLRRFNLLINIWGADHHGYRKRLEVAIGQLQKQLGWNGELKILIIQLVRLISKGKEIKISKRAGTYVTVDELLNEVGIDAARFFFLSHSLDTHMDFDLDLAREKSEKNPVYYVQYAHARISSILKKITPVKKKIPGSIGEREELELIKQLIKLPDLVADIVADYQVQRLPTYAFALAQAFHNFYDRHRVLDRGVVNQVRLDLVKASGVVLRNTLDLMGISAPEKM